MKCYTWSIALYGGDNFTLLEVGQKYLRSFEGGAGEGRGRLRVFGPVVLEIKKYDMESRRKGTSYRQSNERSLTGHILCRNCLLKHVIEGKREGKIEMAGKEE
jgi:hypothetical protein